MKYPKEYLDEIKLRLKVSQVVAKSVQLKKRGKEFIGLSPFKNEKSPSFTVSDEKEFYHCFSTGEHGNIFDFLMKTKSLGFGEAVKALAAEAGMPPYKFTKMDTEKEKRFNLYKNIFREYSDYFHEQIFKSENNKALKYLEERGINQNVIKKYHLGYVPWQNSFYENIKSKFSEEEILLTGLYYKNEKNNKFVDRFNSRIIFPINNLTGETIAFGGRIIKESPLAKYINSPETEFYKKGRTVFNLDKAKTLRTDTNEVVIVEGYMDVVSLYAAGIKNVISNSGTALTETQIDLVWKFFSDPIICLDGDQSGQSAALRIAEKLLILINENNKIYFSILPKGEDPDDYIKKNGKEKFVEFLKSKKIIQSFIWDSYLSLVNTNNPFEISKFEKKIKSACYGIKDEVLKKYILEDFLEKLKNLTPIQSYKKSFVPYAKRNFKILNKTKQLHKEKDHFSKSEIKERSILYILLNHLSSVKNKLEELTEINFTDEQNENLKIELINFGKISDYLDKDNSEIGKKYKSLINDIEKDVNLKNILSKKEDAEREETLNDLMLEIKEMNQLKQIEFLENKVAKNLDESSYSELIKLKSQLNRQ
jgi:DNA primase|tara:strand:- start:1410 stop:3188 length:1779 start_codon:yes stop_codon:yes gene_type:complete